MKTGKILKILAPCSFTEAEWPGFRIAGWWETGAQETMHHDRGGGDGDVSYSKTETNKKCDLFLCIAGCSI